MLEVEEMLEAAPRRRSICRRAMLHITEISVVLTEPITSESICQHIPESQSNLHHLPERTSIFFCELQPASQSIPRIARASMTLPRMAPMSVAQQSSLRSICGLDQANTHCRFGSFQHLANLVPLRMMLVAEPTQVPTLPVQ